MSDDRVSIQVVEQKEESWLDKIRRLTKRHAPPTSLQESERFKSMGYLQYPKTHDRHLRLFLLIDYLEKIETNMERLQDLTDDREKYQLTSKTIRQLFRAFMSIGSPWFKGLDNRELAKKQNAFFKLETQIGHLPAFFPDLKRCMEILISLSWQAVDMVAQNPILMETKTVVQPKGVRIDLGSEVKEY